MILFITFLLVIIFMHEAAHLIAAKSVGCGVEKFSIGLGKPVLWSKKIGDTTYQITPWIIGGYNQLKGELTVSDSPNAFCNLKYRKKLLIALIGVITNITAGFIAIKLAFLLNNIQLFYFGYLSFVIGASNLIPIPGLDGSYPFLMLLELIIKKEKALNIIYKIVAVFLALLIISNIILIPWFLTEGVKLINLDVSSWWGYFHG